MLTTLEASGESYYTFRVLWSLVPKVFLHLKQVLNWQKSWELLPLFLSPGNMLYSGRCCVLSDYHLVAPLLVIQWTVVIAHSSLTLMLAWKLQIRGGGSWGGGNPSFLWSCGRRPGRGQVANITEDSSSCRDDKLGPQVFWQREKRQPAG